jgi:hypothetical protein
MSGIRIAARRYVASPRYLTPLVEFLARVPRGQSLAQEAERHSPREPLHFSRESLHFSGKK